VLSAHPAFGMVPVRKQATDPKGLFTMDIHACVTVRSRPGAGTRVVIYVITVAVVIVLVMAGWTLSAAVLAAAGASWAAGTARPPRLVAGDRGAR
jgi:hypothetical protein